MKIVSILCSFLLTGCVSVATSQQTPMGKTEQSVGIQRMNAFCSIATNDYDRSLCSAVADAEANLAIAQKAVLTTYKYFDDFPERLRQADQSWLTYRDRGLDVIFIMDMKLSGLETRRVNDSMTSAEAAVYATNIISMDRARMDQLCEYLKGYQSGSLDPRPCEMIIHKPLAAPAPLPTHPLPIPNFPIPAPSVQ